MKWWPGVALSATCACAFAACWVGIPDVIPDNDGGLDGSNDVPILPTCEAGACGAPTGWSPVLLASSPTAPCPTGMSTVDLVTNPTVDAGACKCDCSITAMPTCVPQTLNSTYGASAPPCSTPGVGLFVDGGCNTTSGPATLSKYTALPPLPPVDAGACSGNATTDPSKVQSTPARLCVDPSCGSVCTPPSGFQTCWITSGDVPCPSNAPTRHSVGTSVDVGCGACVGCTVSASCQGSFTAYGDSQCQSPLESPLTVDGGCELNSASGAQVKSYIYSPALVGLACTAGTSTPQVSLASTRTVCCP